MPARGHGVTKKKTGYNDTSNEFKNVINSIGTGINEIRKWGNENIKKPILNAIGIDDNSPLAINSIGDAIEYSKGTQTPTIETQNENTVIEEQLTPEQIARQQALEDRAHAEEREDEIRKETQAREDNAIQRQISDMLKAGVNPNLLSNITGSASGGGIMNATMPNTTLQTAELNAMIQSTLNEINNTVKMDENQKDRVNDILRTLLTFVIVKKI